MEAYEEFREPNVETVLSSAGVRRVIGCSVTYGQLKPSS